MPPGRETPGKGTYHCEITKIGATLQTSHPISFLPAAAQLPPAAPPTSFPAAQDTPQSQPPARHNSRRHRPNPAKPPHIPAIATGDAQHPPHPRGTPPHQSSGITAANSAVRPRNTSRPATKPLCRPHGTQPYSATPSPNTEHGNATRCFRPNPDISHPPKPIDTLRRPAQVKPPTQATPAATTHEPLPLIHSTKSPASARRHTQHNSLSKRASAKAARRARHYTTPPRQKVPVQCPDKRPRYKTTAKTISPDLMPQCPHNTPQRPQSAAPPKRPTKTPHQNAPPKAGTHRQKISAASHAGSCGYLHPSLRAHSALRDCPSGNPRP